VQHLSAFDWICASGRREDRVVEYVDHLHEHFLTPVRIERGRYLLPEEPGYSIEIHPESLAEYAFPEGRCWSVPSEAVGETLHHV
jgi:L-fuconate dehydratase